MQLDYISNLIAVVAIGVAIRCWIRAKNAERGFHDIYRELSVERAVVESERAVLRSLDGIRQDAPRWMWAQWWARNAAEYPEGDPMGSPVRQLALATLCATGLPELEQALEHACEVASLHASPGDRIETSAQTLAVTLSQALAELRAPQLPWVLWEQETGKPAHHPGRVRNALRELLSVAPSQG